MLEWHGPARSDGVLTHMACAEADVADASDSCKSAFALALLRQLAGQGHKALVFSQSRRMLDLLAGLLSHHGLALLRIDGTLSAAERQVRGLDSGLAVDELLKSACAGVWMEQSPRPSCPVEPCTVRGGLWPGAGTPTLLEAAGSCQLKGCMAAAAGATCQALTPARAHAAQLRPCAACSAG